MHEIKFYWVWVSKRLLVIHKSNRNDSKMRTSTQFNEENSQLEKVKHRQQELKLSPERKSELAPNRVSFSDTPPDMFSDRFLW